MNLRIALLLFLLLAPAIGHAQPAAADLIRLRNGRELSGHIIQDTSSGYVFIPEGSPSQMKRIPREATAFVLYGNQTQAAKRLGLASDAPDNVHLLAAEPFGKALLKAVHSATQSIWISAYYLSDSRAAPIKDFYATLREKAASGIEVIILAENSTASPPAMRRANANFAAELAHDGIQTLLWSGTNKALHKKLVIVDGRLLLLGSSNLSLSGTYGSIEMNLLITTSHLVQQAIQDFKQLMDTIIDRNGE